MRWHSQYFISVTEYTPLQKFIPLLIFEIVFVFTNFMQYNKDKKFNKDYLIFIGLVLGFINTYIYIFKIQFTKPFSGHKTSVRCP